MPVAIETPRLMLREFLLGDEVALQAILEDPHVRAFKGPHGAGAARRIIEKAGGDRL